MPVVWKEILRNSSNLGKGKCRSENLPRKEKLATFLRNVMDYNLTDNVQNLDNGSKADQSIEDCLHNPVIIRRILEHVSSKELLKISLINKLWKYEARSVLRKRGAFTALLESESDFSRFDTCQRAEAFVLELQEANTVLPLSAVSIVNDYEQHICTGPSGAPVLNYDLNLDQLLLKKVSVTIAGPWLDCMGCPAFILAKKLLQHYCGVLEELELSISDARADFIEKVLQDCNFPKLKILDVSGWMWRSDENTKNYMKALLFRTPNLETLYTDWNINSTLQTIQGTSVEFVYLPPVRAPFDELSENVISAFRVESLELKYTGPGFNFQRFNRMAPMLLQASCTTTLREISVDAVLAVSLMCFGIRLESVKNLRMDIDYSRLQRRGELRVLNIVKNLDFSRIFPNSSRVLIDCEPNNNFPQLLPAHMNSLIEQANAVLAEPTLDRATRVKALYLSQRSFSTETAQYFAEMFPNVKELEIVKAADSFGPIPFRSLWNWLDLNELVVRGDVLPTTGNLDSIFCGIFPEEVEELRLKDDEYLKRVNVVPIMPAISCLRNLTTLSLHHVDSGDDPFRGDDPTFMFSRVTALLVFARLRTLAVSLNISARAAAPAPEMTHLKPYVSVTSNLLNDEDWDY